MSPFSYIINIMAFFTQPGIIQPQAVAFGFAFTHNVVISCAAVHVVYCHTNAVFAVIGGLFNIIAYFVHGIHAAEVAALTDTVMTQAHP